MGFSRTSKDQKQIRQAESKKSPSQRYNITTLRDLDSYFADDQERFRDEKGKIDYDVLLASLRVVGDTQMIGSSNHPEFVHPVAKLLHERKRNNSVCSKTPRSDGCRVALAIEGGGMRGCLSAGMVCALHHLGLEDAFDVVYGSSAGTVVGAYFITRQLPWFGPEVYYDRLTTAGRKFIDTRRLLRAIGFGLLDPRLIKDVLFRPHHGKPVLNLPFLLKTTLQETKRLDWDEFVKRQDVQPLKLVASGLKSEGPVVMDYAGGHFTSIEELAHCMHASCLLPGIAGPIMNLDMNVVESKQSNSPRLFVGNHQSGRDGVEPLADALVYEPLPYRSALNEGATHVVVLRTRPDGTDVTGKSSIFEKLILRRFFLRKNKLPKIFERMRMHLHKKLYAEDVIRLSDAARSQRDYMDLSVPHLLTVAVPPGSPEVSRLETGREAIFEGLRRGFARAYDAMVEDPAERGKGVEVAKIYFPDEILDYDPLEIDSEHESAFTVYMRERNVTPAAWQTDVKEPTSIAR